MPNKVLPAAANLKKAAELAADAARVRPADYASVFEVEGSEGDVYVVTLYSIDNQFATACTCPAGAHGVACYHVRAAQLRQKAIRRGVKQS